MSNRIPGMSPPYPVYMPQAYTGALPPAVRSVTDHTGPFGPPDVRPSQISPAYAPYPAAHGRNLAGLDMNDFDMSPTSADEGIKDYPSELDALQVADDVQGNGMFDPAGSHGNIHPDYGIFADHESIPGYVARDQDYRPSGVTDATTGNQIMFVPGGAVAIDKQQKQAYQDRLLWELPPGVTPYPTQDVFATSTVIPDGAAWPMGAVAEEPSETMTIAKYAAVGLGLGVLGAVVWTMSKTKSTRR